ncbi:hypothetical protein [Bacillus cereus]|uniref:hypothetical protein n=1 Tax=Bacillus cereus TaxID=1396 RepID=UPI0016802B5B|nr:hypothetical protein [Bacillus cereus]
MDGLFYFLLSLGFFQNTCGTPKNEKFTFKNKQFDEKYRFSKRESPPVDSLQLLETTKQ